MAPEVRKGFLRPITRPRKGGRGLGLAIVKHNVEIYGGQIRAESELGQGTRFILTFPRKTIARLRR
jgi:signal transduction histidine kinase